MTCIAWNGVDFRRESDELEQRASDAPPFVELAEARLSHPVGTVRAAIAGVGIQPRAFHVEAKAVARVESDAPGEVAQERAVTFLGIGDEGGEKASAAVGVELLRGVAPGIVRLDRAIKVNAAEAVDLDIDEPRGDPRQVEEVALFQPDGFEMVLLDLHMANLAGEFAGGDFHGEDRITELPNLPN